MTFTVHSDNNRKEIVDRLRELGVQVFDMQRAAKWLPGFPDLLVTVLGKMFLVELKSTKGALSDDQVKFHTLWNGPPIYVLRSGLEAEAWVNRQRTAMFR